MEQKGETFPDGFWTTNSNFINYFMGIWEAKEGILDGYIYYLLLNDCNIQKYYLLPYFY